MPLMPFTTPCFCVISPYPNHNCVQMGESYCHIHVHLLIILNRDLGRGYSAAGPKRSVHYYARVWRVAQLLRQ